MWRPGSRSRDGSLGPTQVSNTSPCLAPKAEVSLLICSVAGEILDEERTLAQFLAVPASGEEHKISSMEIWPSSGMEPSPEQGLDNGLRLQLTSPPKRIFPPLSPTTIRECSPLPKSQRQQEDPPSEEHHKTL